MAVAIPLLTLASGVGAAATAVAAGATVGLGSFLSIAGGLLSTIGVIEKKSSLTKIGGILALGGAAANYFNIAGSTPGATAGANAATGDAAKTAETLTGSKGAAEASAESLIGGGAKVKDAVGTSMMTGVDAAGNVSAPMGGGLGGGSAKAVAESLTGSAAGSPSISEGLMGRVQGNFMTGGGQAMPAPSMKDALAEAARGMTSGEVASAARQVGMQVGAPSLMDRAGGAFKGLTNWIEKNPTVAKFAMDGISGTLASKQQQDALEYQKSLMERARRNLNSPISMSYTPGG